MPHNNIRRDLGIIGLSIFIALLLIKTNALNSLLSGAEELKLIGSFVAGMFFTLVFTVAPATVTLAKLAQNNSLISVALLGGAGAVIGDLIIFQFVRDNLSKDIEYVFRKSKFNKFRSIFHTRMFRWLLSFLGALIVASPLPDEIGLSMMGLAQIKTRWFIPLSFVINSIGIFIVGLLARSLA